MTLQLINLGETGSISGGDSLQIIATKSNSNFIELYNHLSNLDNPHQTTAEQTGAISLSLFAQPNGVATLGPDGILSASQRPPSSGGGAASLWSPGAPNLSEWTPINIMQGVNIIQNGTTSCVVAVQSSTTIYGLMGYTTPVPAPPYKAVFQADSLIGYGGCGDNGFGCLLIGWADENNNGFYARVSSPSNITIFQTYNNAASSVAGTNISGSFAYAKLILEDDGTNISFGLSIDGVNSVNLFSTSKSSTPLSDFGNFFLGIADPLGNGQSFTPSYFNFYLYDPNGYNRSVVAPGY
jgi:hypothetical protein